MSGTICGVRLAFYALMVLAALIFFATRVMSVGSPSSSLKLEDCDWSRQPDREVIETATRTLDGRIVDTSGHLGLGGGGKPTDRLTADDQKVWEMAVASGECPERNAN